MKRAARYASLIFVILLGVSCERAAIEPSDSLVGADHLPSSSVLSRETIQINRGVGGNGFGEYFLSYELRPDNSLLVTHTVRSKDKVRGTDTFHLSPNVATRVRRLLWRVRPKSLDGIEDETRPVGCTSQWDHDFGEAAVAFVGADERIGVFVLPEPRSCQTGQAKEARDLIDAVILPFPPSKAAADWHAIQACFDSDGMFLEEMNKCSHSQAEIDRYWLKTRR